MLRATCRTSSAVGIAVMLVLGAMAYASAAETRDLEEIAASPITVIPDRSGRSAVLQVDTAIDVACSVVYGPDDSFGMISVDNDMDGGAHANHQPVLGGLEPDTTYLYRVQGTAPDGVIYVSEIMTFETLPEPIGGPLNVALGATIMGVSSEWSEAFGAENAFDGDPATEWSSLGDGDEAWVEIDLGAPQRIDELEFVSRSMSDGTARTASFRLIADGQTYGPYPADERLIQIGAEARVLRFEVETSTGGNTGAVEILALRQTDGE